MALRASDLKKYKYFSTLSEKSLEFLANRFVVAQYPAGRVLINEGDAGDVFYFVNQGRMEVTKRTNSGQSAKLAVVGSGQGFGEMALLTGSPRACSVHAITAVILYQLKQADFDVIVQSEPLFRKMLLKNAEDFLHYDTIKVLQPFALLEPDRMYALMARMTERTYAPGEDIIVQGDPGDYYYIVKTGRVTVLKRSRGEQEQEEVAMLVEGDGFGEEALIRDDPRNATCRAIEETTVYALDKVDFSHIIKSSFLTDIFSEDISMNTYQDNYVLIDARVRHDYEEEHIKGALNIPVEILRQKYTELDPSKQYITYCTNDARGMVAAFLLKNHGFNAKCLRGGVSGWTGPVASLREGEQAPGQ